MVLYIIVKKKAQLPVLEERNCSWRIYFTSRNKLNQNEGYFIDVEKKVILLIY